MIPVTKPFLPPKEEYDALVNGIWDRNWLTNNGPLVNELELRLKEYLGLKHLLYVSNGTIALQLAIKALGLKGEIITTPFSYVATTSSIVWEGCEPIYVDIDPNTLNIDPNKLEAAITPRTSAILATHCFGNPCNIDAIQSIAKKHQLKVIYDAAHCFGTTYKGKSIFEYGDITTTSFHATKIFHTIEGGAVFTKDPELLKRMAYMRNFGHDGFYQFNGVGINGKNSEFHAAMGLVNLNYVDRILKRRHELTLAYNELLDKITTHPIQFHQGCNYAYYPIIFSDENELLKVLDRLQSQKVSPRRYFYPALTSLDYVERFKLCNVENVAQRILCLPMYFDLRKEEVNMISRIILRVINYG